MSQSLWHIGRPDLNAFFFFLILMECLFFSLVGCLLLLLLLFLFFLSFWAADVSNFSRSQPLFSMKYGTWFMDEQDTTRRSTELKKSVVQSVLFCLSYLFIILTSKLVKKLKKNSQAKKLKAWILLNQTRTKKQMRATALKHRIFFF